jgi:cyanophycin synthetase
MSDRTSIIAVEMAQDKDLTRQVLRGIGLQVPAGAAVHSVEAAVEVAHRIGFPVILKPLSANQGRGISPALHGEADVRWAWERAAEFHPDLVVEQYVEGRDHRVAVVNGRVVAVAERVAAHVVGDGVRTIRQLIDDANTDSRRGPGHSHILSYLPADAVTEDYLSRSGRTLETVPAAGERVQLRATANLSTGGTSIDRTDEIHPDNVTACEMAAGVIGLDIAGLDVLTPDISVPFHENGAVIIEVNASPGIRMHTHPDVGLPRNVPGAILDMLYPQGARATIPVLAVTGTNGKTTTTRLIAHLFRHAGRVVGFTTTDGVYLQSRLVVAGDMTGPFGANVILSNPTVEIAVLETARGGILRSGLGFEECDVGIVLNVTGDHLGLDGIHTLDQLAEVKGVIPSVVKRRGYAVLNVDDPRVAAMRELTRGDVVFFSARTDGIEHPDLTEHLADGGTAVKIEGDEFVVRRGRLCIPIARVRDVPLTLGGAAEFQFENVAAAIAAAFVQGMRYEEIRAGLLTFFPSAALTPGRLNVMRVRHGRVLVDYAHNPAAVQAIVDLVLRMDARRRIGVITVPGDRRDDDIRAAARPAARLDQVIVKEDADLRGRPPGEIARLITEGLRAGGMDESRIVVVQDEPAAVRHAVERMQPGDLTVVLAEDVPAVLAQLEPLHTGP